MNTKNFEKKAWQQLHKNDVRCIEQVMEAASDKIEAVQPITTYHETHPN